MTLPGSEEQRKNHKRMTEVVNRRNVKERDEGIDEVKRLKYMKKKRPMKESDGIRR